MGDTRKSPRGVARLHLYAEPADWWPLCSAPEDYREEAGIYRRALIAHSRRRPRTVLELGSGGGNNALHLKKHFRMTLVDRSPGMLRVSRALNPDCTHVRGDMRTVRVFFLSPKFTVDNDAKFGNASQTNLKEGKLSAQDYLLYGAAHELGHSFLNPIVDMYKVEIDKINFIISTSDPSKRIFLCEVNAS